MSLRFGLRAPGIRAPAFAAGMLWVLSAHAGMFDCLIEPRQTVDVRAASEGLIVKMNVQRGDIVKAGQVLVELDSGLERANADLTRFKAATEATIHSKESRLEFATVKSSRREHLARQSYVSAQDRDESLAEKKVAEADLVEARDNKRMAELEHRRALEQLRLRSIKSPFDGVVVDRMMNVGDLADNRDLRKPVLKIAEISTLHVEALLPASAHGAVQPEQAVEVIPDLPGGHKYPAKIRVIDRVMDAASGTFGVRMELPNPSLRIPAGVKCKVRIDGVQEAAPRKR